MLSAVNDNQGLIPCLLNTHTFLEYSLLSYILLYFIFCMSCDWLLILWVTKNNNYEHNLIKSANDLQLLDQDVKVTGQSSQQRLLYDIPHWLTTTTHFPLPSPGIIAWHSSLLISLESSLIYCQRMTLKMKICQITIEKIITQRFYKFLQYICYFSISHNSTWIMFRGSMSD